MLVCRNCGCDNPPHVRYCKSCGMEMDTMVTVPISPETQNRRQQKKQAQTVIIVLLVVAIVLLCVLTGVLLSRSSASDENGFDSDIREVLLPSETNTPSEEKTEEIETTNAVSTALSERPEQTPARAVPNEKTEKKNAFLAKAEGIEQYGREYLDTADTQHAINRESGVVFEKWDVLLNEVYQYLKTVLPEDEFKQLQADELAWITEKENAMAETAAEWGSGSGAPMARNMTGIQFTKERCYYLISLIN